jgi:hypothetical protein
MLKERKAIIVRADTDLTKLLDLLDSGSESSLVLERDGMRYSLSRAEEDDDEEWSEERAARVRETLAKTASALADLDIDIDQWIADIYRAREEGSRGWPRS